MKSFFLAFTVLIASLAWTLALIADSTPWESAPAMLIGVGLLTTATVGLIGLVATGGRWAHRLSLSTLAATLVVALVRPVDPWWAVGITSSALSAICLMTPSLTSRVRKLPAAAGPPPRAVAPALILLATPTLLGLAGNGAVPWALLVVGLSAPNFAFLYARVLPGGLLGIRLIWPVLAMTLAWPMGWPAGAVSAGIGMLVAVVSWNRAVKSSYHPPTETGTSFPIPPELAPSEILDAANVDDSGRPK